VSLTSFLELADVRARFREEFQRPTRKRPARLLIEPTVQPEYRGRLGTAFDYLARFALQQRYPGATTKRWLAETGLEIVRSQEDTRASQRQRRAIARLERQMDKAKQEYSNYLNSGMLTDGLLEAAWHLAFLDEFRRAPIPPLVLLAKALPPDRSTLAELRTMLELFPVTDFAPRQRLFLNPTFGPASMLVGGADADVIVDSTLIDIKTNADPKLPRKDFNQLVGYAALAELGGVQGANLRIEQSQVYLARFGTMVCYSRREVIDEERWPDFLNWLEKRAALAFPHLPGLAS
jgi:hypothetical protein